MDKVTFIEYTKLPGIINDRIHYMFSNYKNSETMHKQLESSPKETLQSQKKGDFVTEENFVQNFTTIFIGDLDQKMKFAFEMYDFDNDGYITAEDIRIFMSYMPFNRNVQFNNVQSMLDKGMERVGSPGRGRRERPKIKEGLYQEEEGKNINYKDRMCDQEEIKAFTDNIFRNGLGGCSATHMSYKAFEHINKNVSSEMFYSLMAILHEKLPCATNYFRLRKNFKDAHKNESSPIRTLASPKMIRGLSIPKTQRSNRKDQMSEGGRTPKILSPDFRIRNLKNAELRKSTFRDQIKSAGAPNKRGIIN